MKFEEKSALIDVAVKLYPTFRREFNDYLALGHSHNGAYHHFTLEDIERHKTIHQKQEELNAWDTAHGSVKSSSPTPLKEHSILSDLEKLNDELSNS